MKQIFSSASKIVFILMALALVAFTAMGIVSGEMFFTALGMVFGYYFKGITETPKL
ncbi:MAG: hypothetical protein WCN88_04840 [Candidatus Falkowbacteria bacterium]